jgi:lysophospholipase L1-like esterase
VLERTRHLAIGLLLSCLSLFLTLACAELGVRALQGQGLLPRYSGRSVGTPNARLNARVVRSADPLLHLEHDRRDPNVNRAGHRGADFALERRPGTFRIAVLGDSVAYGYSVPLAETFPALLEGSLNRSAGDRRFEVLNFSVIGYGTEAELELYRTKVRSYRPDLVLLAYVLNDPIPPQFLTGLNLAAGRASAAFARLAELSQCAAWLEIRWQRATELRRAEQGYAFYYGNPVSWRAVQDSVAALARESRADGARLVAVVFPLLLDFSSYPMRDYHRRIAGELERSGVPYLDLLPAFAREPATALRIADRDDTHPNALGHQIAAREIERFLVETGALAPPGAPPPAR